MSLGEGRKTHEVTIGYQIGATTIDGVVNRKYSAA
jgi:hypothetical protein